MPDIWYEIPELVAEVSREVSPAMVKATYTAGPTLRKQTGKSRELWVGIYNSAFNGGPRAEMEAAAGPIAALASRWLRAHDLAKAGTAIHIQFGDASEWGPVSWSNALETIRFELDSLGEEHRIASSGDDPFRKLRYRMSGRREP